MKIRVCAKRAVMFMVLLLAVSAAASGNDGRDYTEATDAYGRRVFLYEDSTWELAPPDIRELYWGMSMEQVRSAEHVRLFPDGNTLLGLNASAYGMNGMMFMEFEQDQLVLLGYLFIENHPDGDQYIEDYRDLVEQFSETYGDPTDEITEWTGRKSDDLGEAFLQGDVEIRTEWKTERSNIGCGLVNDQDLFGLLVGYEYIHSR